MRIRLVLSFIVAALTISSPIEPIQNPAQALATSIANSLSNAPKGGCGIFQRLRNQTDFDLGVKIGVEPQWEDMLPSESLIRIKSLANNKFFSCRLGQTGTYTCKADTDDPKDRNTLFTVYRGTSRDLTPRISLAPADNPKYILSADTTEDARLLKLILVDFTREENTQCHWEVDSPFPTEPTRLDGVYLKNRLTRGRLTTFHGKETVKVTPDSFREEKIDAVWGIGRGDLVKFGDHIRLRAQINNEFLKSDAPGDFIHTNNNINDPGAIWKFAKWNNEPPRDPRHISFGDAGALIHTLTNRLLRITTRSQATSTRDRGFKFEPGVTVDEENANGWNNGPHWWEAFGIFDANTTELGKRNIISGDIVTFRFWSPKGKPTTTWLNHHPGTQSRSEVNPYWGGNGGRFIIEKLNTNSMIYRNDTNWNPTQSPYNFTQFAIINKQNVWAITKDGKLFHLSSETNDNLSWQEEGLGIGNKYVSASVDGDIYVVGVDGIVRYKDQGTWREFPGKWKIISVRNKNEVWGVGEDDQIYKYSNQTTKEVYPITYNALDVAVSSEGDVWAINKQNQVYCRNATGWQLIPNRNLSKIAVRNNNFVYGVGTDGKLYFWDGKAWTQRGDDFYENIAVSAGVKKIFVPGQTKEIDVEGASTVDQAGKPQDKAPNARIAIEIEKIGMGGGIAPQTTSDYADIPAKKQPIVYGYAQTRLEKFDAGATLSLTPLLSKGVAWLETSLSTPNRATISFVARAGDKGGIQIVFGQDISTEFSWKITIGDALNSKATIVKRTIVNNQAKDIVVAQVLPKIDPTNPLVPVNPLARALSGNATPYWVIIDNGLILVGMGNPGENIFLSWRDPAPPERITRIGLGSDTAGVDYANIQVLPPLSVEKPARAYVAANKNLPVSSKASWSEYPFRVDDRGMAAFSINESNMVTLLLGPDQETDQSPDVNANDHYKIVFDNGISVQKWIAAEKKLKSLAKLDNAEVNAEASAAAGNKASSSLAETPKTDAKKPKITKSSKKTSSKKAAKDKKARSSKPTITTAGTQINQKTTISDSSKTVHYWISYSYGQIIIGKGPVGKNIIMVVQDIAPIDEIRQLGFVSIAGKSATLSDLTIYPPCALAIEKSGDAYKQQPVATPFSGALTIIAPFQYQFSQLDQVIKLEDLVNHLSFYPGPTPGQGTLYKYMLTLNKGGTPMLELTEAPDSQLQKEVQNALIKMGQQADIQRANAAQISRQGTIQQQLSAAQAQQLRGENAAHMQVATFMQGSAGAFAMSPNPIAMIGAATMMAGATAYAGVASQSLFTAANKELEGAEAQVAADKQAGLAVNQAEIIDAQVRSLKGQFDNSVRLDNSYVYTDTADRTALGQLQTPQEALENLNEIRSILPMMLNPTMDTFTGFLNMLDAIISKITHFSVVSNDAIRRQIQDRIDMMFTAYTKQFFPFAGDRPPALQAQVVKILINAYNNAFLVNQLNKLEVATKRSWNTKINQLTRELLLNPDAEIEMPPMTGEYIWLPSPIVDNKVTITFKAIADSDIFVCFSPVNNPVRNTSTELYELVIGGWDDTKTALRIKSLDKSAKEIPTTDLLDPLDFRDYWIAYDNGAINFGTGTNPEDDASIVFSWQDPYPDATQPMKYIGFSNWQSPITLKNVTIVGAEVQASATPEATVPVAAKNLDAEVPADDQLQADYTTIVPGPTANVAPTKQQPAQPVKTEKQQAKPKIPAADKKLIDPTKRPAAKSAADIIPARTQKNTTAPQATKAQQIAPLQTLQQKQIRT